MTRVTSGGTVRERRRALGPEVLQAVLAVDPHGKPPQAFARSGDVNTVPALPASAQLSAAQRQQAGSVGRWLDEYVSWSSGAANETPLHVYERALREMTAPSAPLDDRLRTVYGRLHVQALKVALCLAALDWVAMEGRPQKPSVRAAHWYRAQQIAEVWRASAHRLLYDLGESEEARLEARILKLLAGRREGLSVRSIYRALRSPRKPVIEALKALEQDGQMVGEVVKNNGPGRPSERYGLVGEYGA